MISAFTNTFKVPELRSRVLFTLLMLVVVRIGAAITIDAAEPRSEAFRTSADYVAYCRTVSNALAPSYPEPTR